MSDENVGGKHHKALAIALLTNYTLKNPASFEKAFRLEHVLEINNHYRELMGLEPQATEEAFRLGDDAKLTRLELLMMKSELEGTANPNKEQVAENIAWLSKNMMAYIRPLKNEEVNDVVSTVVMKEYAARKGFNLDLRNLDISIMKDKNNVQFNSDNYKVFKAAVHSNLTEVKGVTPSRRIDMEGHESTSRPESSNPKTSLGPSL